ncbi:MAG: NADH-quinone oxidoreductase subunit I [Elusimicrobia bacterium]|nr:NADH-quinone oxidoreductase subunit I [Elusimicrobiota bacterium]
MNDYFKHVFASASAIVQGLWITLRYLVKPAITVQYPTEKLVPYERFRGALLFDAETCIACNLCVKACPSSCIALENATTEAGKKVAKVAWYSIDFGKCNFCKLCEEACPTKPKSVWHSLDYEVLFANRDEMVRGWQREFLPAAPSIADRAREFVGRFFDRKAKAWKAPQGQVQIQSVQARR